MATLTRGQTFGVTESITNTKLHNLVDLGTVTNIVDADISAGAAIQFSKLLASSIDGSLLRNLGNIVSSAGTIPFINLPLPLGATYVSLVSIPNSSLLPLTLASWVDGIALRNLTSLPSAAGIVPIANLASGTPTGLKFVRDDSTLVIPINTFKTIFTYVQSTIMAATDKFTTFGATAINASVNTYTFQVPYAGTAKNMYVSIPTSSGDMAFTIYKNGVATALTIAISSGNTSGSDTTHTVSFAAGDTLQFSFSDASAATKILSVSMEYD